MKKDFVCGMLVPETSKFKTHKHNDTYYFCSQHCKTKFDASPDTYLHPSTIENIDTCPDGSCDIEHQHTQHRGTVVKGNLHIV